MYYFKSSQGIYESNSHLKTFDFIIIFKTCILKCRLKYNFVLNYFLIFLKNQCDDSICHSKGISWWLEWQRKFITLAWWKYHEKRITLARIIYQNNLDAWWRWVLISWSALHEKYNGLANLNNSTHFWIIIFIKICNTFEI